MTGQSQPSSTSSYFMEQQDRRKPLNPNNASLNETLQTQYLDLDEDDDSFLANVTRSISNMVGTCCKPKQVLGLLRILKAVTLAFLIMNILANLIYIVAVELAASDEVKDMAGGRRDLILRLYGLGLSVLGLAVELDYTKVVRKFSALKGFLPRALLYFFIAQITCSHPIAYIEADNSYGQNNNYNNGNDDAAEEGDGDDAAANDDAYAAAATASSSAPELPSFAVGFQRVTSFVLCCCALGYLICGLLCFDRFTARAFLTSRDPVSDTAVPASAAANNFAPPRADSSSADDSNAA